MVGARATVALHEGLLRHQTAGKGYLDGMLRRTCSTGAQSASNMVAAAATGHFGSCPGFG
jgi:hypothetical protein